MLNKDNYSPITIEHRAVSTTALVNGFNIVKACVLRNETFMSDESKSYEEEVNDIESNERLGPKEKLFAKLFCHETKIVVKDMDKLTLRAHIEELEQIAFEANTRWHAATAEDKRKNKISTGPTGFERSLNTDESAIKAINTIKERQTRISKKEQVQAQLKKLYEMSGSNVSDAEIEKKLTSGTILGRIKEKASEIDGAAAVDTREPEKIFNPFDKKS